jgi:hypothetical protein
MAGGFELEKSFIKGTHFLSGFVLFFYISEEIVRK